MKVHVITLGCPKNTVDSETMMGHLAASGAFLFTEQVEAADVIIINTCAFLLSAREEAIDTILRAVEVKTNGRCRYVYVVGCLPQKYRDELESEIPEVDGFFDQLDFAEVAHNIAMKMGGRYRIGPRQLITPHHYAYLKIAEGCDNRCSYCTIPSIKGRFISRQPDKLIADARQLGNAGVKELILVAQDTTQYGHDLSPGYSLFELLTSLVTIDSLEWIRLLYTHPKHWDERILSLLVTHRKICRYIDMPIQHAAESILLRMNRQVTALYMRQLFKNIRTKLPDIYLRTTVIVGFPGETDADFETLCEFISDIKFERLGVFKYSPEEDTPAFRYDDKVEAKVVDERFRHLLELQQSIAAERHNSMIGKTVQAIVDEYDELLGCYIARSQGESPDIDPQIILNGDAEVGQFVHVHIDDADAYELHGTVVAGE